MKGSSKKKSALKEKGIKVVLKRATESDETSYYDDVSAAAGFAPENSRT
jgi:hypothetical protein